MTTKPIAVLSSNSIKITSLSSDYCTFSSYRLTASNETFTLPLHWSAIEALLKSYDRIIISDDLHSNDRMQQGSSIHYSFMVLHIFHQANQLAHKEVYFLHDNELFPLDTFNSNSFIQSHSYSNGTRSMDKTVTSIQKNHVPESFLSNDSENWVGIYFQFLQSFTFGLIKIEKKESEYHFFIRGIPLPLLILERNDAIPNALNVTELVIKKGILNGERKSQRPFGRFWFVFVAKERALYTSLVHFKPSLPWVLYRLSQGWIHGFVMKQFQKFIMSMEL